MSSKLNTYRHKLKNYGVDGTDMSIQKLEITDIVEANQGVSAE